jgi:serine/threonine protein kinase
MRYNTTTHYFTFLREAEINEYIPTGRSLGIASPTIAFEVVHPRTGRKYIAKIMTADQLKGYENYIEKEIRIMQWYSKTLIGSNNNHLLRLIDSFRIINDGQTHVCMILDMAFQNNDLFDAIRDKGAFPEDETKKIIRSLFRAVNYLHQCGIVHRDIKAENILFEGGQPILADFGLAEFCKLNETTLTEFCGTPGTTAPEIIRNESYGSKCDIYSLGILTYFLLAGYRPFDWTTEPREEMEAILQNKFCYPEESFADISLEAQDFINRCMFLEPNERPSAEEALQHPWLKE